MLVLWATVEYHRDCRKRGGCRESGDEVYEGASVRNNAVHTISLRRLVVKEATNVPIP